MYFLRLVVSLWQYSSITSLLLHSVGCCVKHFYYLHYYTLYSIKDSLRLGNFIASLAGVSAEIICIVNINIQEY